jgi:hypothetical protein
VDRNRRLHATCFSTKYYRLQAKGRKELAIATSTCEKFARAIARVLRLG